MSRIGKQVIQLPKGVQVSFQGGVINVKGAKGALSRRIHDAMDIKIEPDKVSVVLKPAYNPKECVRFHGLTRTLVANMVKGVTEGFSKSLTMVGVGYRANPQGKGVSISLGFSHPIEFVPPPGIEVKVDKQTTLIVSGAEKELVGQVAAELRSFRAPEPYHGKGVRYVDEVISTKVGKAAGKAK